MHQQQLQYPPGYFPYPGPMPFMGAPGPYPQAGGPYPPLPWLPPTPAPPSTIVSEASTGHAPRDPVEGGTIERSRIRGREPSRGRRRRDLSVEVDWRDLAIRQLQEELDESRQECRAHARLIRSQDQRIAELEACVPPPRMSRESPPSFPPSAPHRRARSRTRSPPRYASPPPRRSPPHRHPVPPRPRSRSASPRRGAPRTAGPPPPYRNTAIAGPSTQPPNRPRAPTPPAVPPRGNPYNLSSGSSDFGSDDSEDAKKKTKAHNDRAWRIRSRMNTKYHSR